MSANIKSYKDHYLRLLYSKETKLFFEELSKHVSIGNGDMVALLLDILKKESKLKLLASHRGNEGESILHVAAKFNQSSEIIEALIKTCPELLTTTRRESEEYHGQTALHIAIAKGNVEAVETMLSEILNLSQNLKSALLHQLATGNKFVNTVMMGELPLSVAALTFNEEMIFALLQNGADMERRNTKGDTVFHTLIRYAAVYPEHVPDVMATLNYLYNLSTEKIGNLGKAESFLSMEYDHNDYSYIWFIQNNDDLNALQLAATLSQAEIFDLIMTLPKVYTFLNNHDGLFDQKLIDITDIDTVTTEKWSKQQQMKENRMQRHTAPTAADGVSKHKFSNKNTSCSPFDLCKREKRKSILEIMFDIKGEAAFEIIQHHTVRQIIKTKWLFYRRFYYGWMLFHLAFMLVLTIYSILQADDIVTLAESNQTSVNAEVRSHHRGTFLEAYRYIYLLVGVIYFFQEVLHLLFRVKNWDLVQILNVLHNGSYRIILLLFSLSLVIDFILCQTLSNYENYSLVIALITGWWFTIFFLRAQKRFSFFTVMIQKVIFGDMLRFSVIISLALISFTAGIYMAFKGAIALTEDEAEDLSSYGTTMLLLFQLMLGLGDIQALYKARQPWMAVTLFVVFVLLTYVLMFNALIAMMSQTCTLVSQNRNVQWRVQQLSIITFFEGIFPSCMQKMVGTEKSIKRYNPSLKQVIEEKRYFLDVSSLRIEYANAEDIYSVQRKLQTTYFRDHFSPYSHFELTMQTPRNMYSCYPSPNFYHRDGNETFRGTDIVITRAPEENSPKSNNDRSPLLHRNKSERIRNPSEASRNKAGYHSDGENITAGIKKPKKKVKKKRIEPEGDMNTPFDDHNPSVNHFHLNYGDLNHLDIPERFPKPQPQYTRPQLVRQESRRRYHSENSLIDTHVDGGQQKPMSVTHTEGSPLLISNNEMNNIKQPIKGSPLMQQPIRNIQVGGPQQPLQPIRRVQMPVHHISSIANQNQGNGHLDIGIISDSYM